MAGEAVIATSNGAIVLNSDGKRMVHNASADPCCGGTPCDDCTTGPTTIDLVVSGLNITCPCDETFGDPPGGVLTEIAGGAGGAHTLTRDPPTGIFAGFGSCVFVAQVSTIRSTSHTFPCGAVSSTTDYHGWLICYRSIGHWTCAIVATDIADTTIAFTIVAGSSADIDCATDFTASADNLCDDGSTHVTASYSGSPA